MSDQFVELSELLDEVELRIGELKAWVRVEIDSLSVSRGHHYFGFIQKAESGEELARARGILWHSLEWKLAEFEQETGQKLQAGMSILTLVSVQFNARFGLSLIVEDIDTAFTIGQKEKEKKATIQKLSELGLIEKQRSLHLPFLPVNIAVLSSKDAAGYGDFVRHLQTDGAPYKFNFTLLHSLMQGDACPESLSSALDKVSEYDLVLILRGGGAESDLACYDDFSLAKSIAECPVPVLTAIGHERDCHIADMVAYEHFKTPTALADCLIEWFSNVESMLFEALNGVADACSERIDTAEREVTRCLSNIRFALSANIKDMESKVALLEAGIKNADPRNILNQGYLLAIDEQGKILKKSSSKDVGDNFTLRFTDGRWLCTINEKKYE